MTLGSCVPPHADPAERTTGAPSVPFGARVSCPPQAERGKPTSAFTRDDWQRYAQGVLTPTDRVEKVWRYRIPEEGFRHRVTENDGRISLRLLAYRTRSLPPFEGAFTAEQREAGMGERSLEELVEIRVEIDPSGCVLSRLENPCPRPAIVPRAREDGVADPPEVHRAPEPFGGTGRGQPLPAGQPIVDLGETVVVNVFAPGVMTMRKVKVGDEELYAPYLLMWRLTTDAGAGGLATYRYFDRTLPPLPPD